MRLAVAGGTGTVGRHVVEAAGRAGHDVTVLTRRNGVDVVSGDGLAAALSGIDAVVDVTNAPGTRRSSSVAFFETATRNLLAAERNASVAHHVVLSIVGIDRVPFGYYEGKRRQESLVSAGGTPWTVLRATQFHEFPAQLLSRQPGPVAVIPRMRSATVAAAEVGARLVELAAGSPAGRAADFGGPQAQEMPDLVRRLLRARGQRRLVIPARLPGAAGRGMADGGLLPSGDGPTGRQTFDEWLRAAADT